MMSDPVNLALNEFITSAEYKADRDRIRQDPDALAEIVEKFKDGQPELYKAFKEDPTLGEQIIEELDIESISGEGFEVDLDENMMQQLGRSLR